MFEGNGKFFIGKQTVENVIWIHWSKYWIRGGVALDVVQFSRVNPVNN